MRQDIDLIQIGPRISRAENRKLQAKAKKESRTVTSVLRELINKHLPDPDAQGTSPANATR